MLEFVSGLYESVDFFVLGVDLFFEFALGVDEVLVGSGEVVASCAYPCDDAAYCYAGESDDGGYYFGHIGKSTVDCFDMLGVWIVNQLRILSLFF